jgi:hypothetical protein
MKSPARFALFVFVLAAILLTACGAAATQAPSVAPEPPVAVIATAAPLVAAAPEAKTVGGGASAAEVSTMPGDMTVVQTGADNLTGAQADRMIVKNAEVRLLVAETDDAIDRALQVVGDVSGYIISSKVWYQESNGANYKYATVTIGVPVDQFETAMRRLRALSIRVLDENASGQDVTDEYVDLQSQLGNLEATRDRIRSFLDNAQTVDESLRINQELANIEGQIEQVKGRMNYLSNRSAFSTITATFEPDIPPLPTPTLTATPTPLPTPTPKVWKPGETFGQARDTVVSAYQAIFELLIWLFVVVMPILLPPVLIVWAIWKFATRKKA